MRIILKEIRCSHRDMKINIAIKAKGNQLIIHHTTPNESMSSKLTPLSNYLNERTLTQNHRLVAIYHSSTSLQIQITDEKLIFTFVYRYASPRLFDGIYPNYTNKSWILRQNLLQNQLDWDADVEMLVWNLTSLAKHARKPIALVCCERTG